MRRTGNVPFSPAIGMVTGGTSKIGLTSDCACAVRTAAAPPASASAPDANSDLRSTVFISRLRNQVILTGYLPPVPYVGKLVAAASPKKKARRSGPSAIESETCSPFDVGRQFSAVGGKLRHHLLVQPDVHGGGIIGVAGISQLLRQILARGEAGIDVERFHQVDDRGAPRQFLVLGSDRLVEDRCDIDGLRGRSGCRRRSAASG